MYWIEADDRSKVPKHDTDALLCVLIPKARFNEEFDDKQPWLMMGTIKVYSDGDYGFLTDDDPWLGDYVTHWMPLPPSPIEVAGLLYEEWKEKQGK